MNIKSFGCSFIYGSELSDERIKSGTSSQLSWPSLLAKQLNYKYKCYACPGAGNLQILEQILNQISTIADDLFIIGWSWIDRFDYYPPQPTTRLSQWSTIMPSDQSETAKIYYRDLHSEYRDKFTNLSYIKLAIDTLKQKNIPYIMTYMDNLLFDQRWHTSSAVLDLQQYIKPHMTMFEGKNFLEWSQHYNYPISENLHPLEQAHQAAAEYIKDLTGIIK